MTRMQPGKKLASALATQLTQAVHTAGPKTLAEISQVCTSPRVRPLHGDLQDDFQEAISRRLNEFNTREVVDFALAFTSCMRGFDGSEAYRALRRKLLPAVMMLLREPEALRRLRRLGGVPRLAEEAASGRDDAAQGA